MSLLRRSGKAFEEESFLTRRIKLFSWIIFACWTVLITASWCWNYYAEQQVFHKVAQAEARAVIERDALYRRWAAARGGVYVPATPESPPNNYLSHIPERDISTPSGRHLTLVNPAYMTRQVNELSKIINPFLGQAHITSLNPLRPENAPDPWEAGALRSFESGLPEVSELVTVSGKPFLRLMKPFVTEEPCLKCHAEQGYTAGSIRGGISVSIPVQPLIDAGQAQFIGSLVFHGAIWLLGLAVASAGARHLSRNALLQKLTENELHLQTLQLEEEMAERQTAQELLQKNESRLRIVADFSSNWEYWRLPDNRFLYMSPSVEAITGYSREEFEHDEKLILSIIYPDDRELFCHHIHGTDSRGHVQPIEHRITCKNGEVRWISHICQQVYTADGMPWGWRASNQDITDRKQVESKLFEQKEQLVREAAQRTDVQARLEELNYSLEERIRCAVAESRSKDQTLIQQSRLAAMGEMINNIAHQWRQPLNNIALIVQGMQVSCSIGTSTTQELQHDIDKTMDVIMHMSRTIDDFRNFFRKDKQQSEFPVGVAIERALDFVSAIMSSHGIRVEFSDDRQIRATGYQNEYAQVLLNILSNARETAVERNISSPCVWIDVTGINGHSLVTIRDNCGGIADDVLPRIFDPYFTTRAPDKGTGIGLYMSKIIVEQNMNGSLTAINTEDGAEFRIEV